MKAAVSITLAVITCSTRACCASRTSLTSCSSSSTPTATASSSAAASPPSIALMGLINILFTVDTVGKFGKFMKMSHTDADIEEKTVEMSSSMAIIRLPTAKKEWSKVRGLQAMGAFREPKKDKRGGCAKAQSPEMRNCAKLFHAAVGGAGISIAHSRAVELWTVANAQRVGS
jgi:hypothetical protein